MSLTRRVYFGGTFNPVHIGHARMAYEVCTQYPCEFYFVPCHIPPHKPVPQIASEHRLAMLNLTLGNLNSILSEDCCAIEEYELGQPSTSYSVETLAYLRNSFPNDQINWLVGMDSLVNLNTWHRWTEIFDFANLWVVDRPGCVLNLEPELDDWVKSRELPAKKAGAYGGVSFIKTTPVAVSSSLLRQSMDDGLCPDFLVPQSVANYINQHKLYC